MGQDEPLIAIVTGAGSGIGQGIAFRFARDGIRVLAVDRNPAGLAATCDDPRGGGRIRPCAIDITEEHAPAFIFEQCRRELGEPNYLVNNAGIGIARKPGQGNTRTATDTTDQDLDEYMAINFRSLFRLSREFVRTTDRPERAIVNISSIFGFVGSVGSAAYSASKAAVIGLTRQMTADYAPLGIRINCVAPGLIATPATYDRIANNPRYRQLSLAQVPMGRAGTPADVASVVRFLCSPDAAYVCGAVLVVDGGWTATRYIAPSDAG